MTQLELFPSVDKDKIITDLFQAYFDARKNKRNTLNALKFEKDFESNIFNLADDIVERNYHPGKSICFIVNKPVKREIFAADFRDRVVHHFIYNYISPVFEKSFIHDSYSCRKGKGTHYGIKRIARFIRSCSNNYKTDCHILKLDIRGYFMSIDKTLLFRKVISELEKNRNRITFDLPLTNYLISKTIFNDPTEFCVMKGSKKDWEGLPASKSLFHAKPGCGLPIGNLTSQLFGNVYLNEFDHFVKRDLGIRYYGRYVDDFVLIHPDKEYLISLIPWINRFLSERLGLQLHPDKIYLQHYSKGLAWLGVCIKPHRIYIGSRTKGNFHDAMTELNKIVNDRKPTGEEQQAMVQSMNSYLGIMGHYKTFRLRKKMLFRHLSGWWWRYVHISGGYRKMAINTR